LWSFPQRLPRPRTRELCCSCKSHWWGVCFRGMFLNSCSTCTCTCTCTCVYYTVEPHSP
jgi:hypothetical protein